MENLENRYNLGVGTLNTDSLRDTKKGREAISNSLQGFQAEGFTTGSPGASDINPEIWDEELQRYAEQSTSISGRAKEYTTILNTPGSTHRVNLDEAPTGAEELTEGTATPISELFYDSVVFEPTEYGKAYQITRKQARRSFFDLMPNAVQKIGYSLSINREQVAIDLAISEASINVFGGFQADAASLTNDDTLSIKELSRAVRLMRENLHSAISVDVTPKQFEDLVTSEQLLQVNFSGSDGALRGYRTGTLLGLEVTENTFLPTDYENDGSDVQVAVVLGVTQPAGDEPIGISWKATPEIRMDDFVTDRYAVVGGEEEWDMQVLRPAGIATIQTK